jgi:hypothetical protein
MTDDHLIRPDNDVEPRQDDVIDRLHLILRHGFPTDRLESGKAFQAIRDGIAEIERLRAAVHPGRDVLTEHPPRPGVVPPPR